MSSTFFIADLHLGHKLMAAPAADGGPGLRPWASTEEHDEQIISRWNSVVSPKDKVFLLGDIVINRRCLTTAARLQGKITLVMGNHETMRAAEYLSFCSDLKGAVDYKGWLLTHVPVHPGQLSRWSANVHGHLHKATVGDPRYLCVSAEQTDYRPLPYEALRERLRQQSAA